MDHCHLLHILSLLQILRLFETYKAALNKAAPFLTDFAFMQTWKEIKACGLDKLVRRNQESNLVGKSQAH